MKKTCHIGRCAYLTILVLGVATTRAFEGWEHEAVSKLSFMAASNYVNLTFNRTNTTDVRLSDFHRLASEFTRGMSNKGKKHPITFGRLVKLGDYMRDPYDMLHPTNATEALPTEPSSANIEFLENVGGSLASLASAAHLNFNHFQGRAVYSFWFWHKQAVEAAARSNLFAALLLEGYADHYLEDFFAPGHVVAPRDEDSHDQFAMSLHDYYNKAGLGYLVREPAPVRTFAESLQSLPMENITGLDEGVFDHDKAIKLTPEAINAFLGELDVLTNIVCHGDKMMTNQVTQLPLIVTYCGRAIADVIESFLYLQPVNHFQKYRWNALLDSGVPTLQLVDVYLSFGNLACTNLGKSRLEKIYDKYAGVEKKTATLTNYLVQENLTYGSLLNPNLNFNFGGQSIHAHGETHFRGLAEAMLVYAPFRMDEKLRSQWLPDQMGFGVGYSGVYDTREYGNGFVSRIVLPSPKLNLQLSFNGGVRYYSDGGVEGWGDFETVRLEWGMHLANVFVGGGHDHYARGRSSEHRAGVVDGYVFEAGLSFGLPLSRWSGNRWPWSRRGND